MALPQLNLEASPELYSVVNLGLYFCARTIASEQAMASEPVKVDSPSQDLTEDHLQILHNILYEVRSKYRLFGIQIGLLVSDIDGAESKYTDHGERLLEILILRVKKAHPFKWTNVDDALRLQCVGMSRLAECLWKTLFDDGGANPDQEERIRMKGRQDSDYAMTQKFQRDFQSDKKNDDCKPKIICDRGEYESLSSSSDTDDSSAECATPSSISAAKKKELEKMFKRYFGKLCCTMSDPVRTAAELQHRGLISKSLMTNLMMSHESKEKKCIILVSTLEEKLKCKPTSLLVLVEVLLKDNVLQDLGREIFNKAGKLSFAFM